MFIRNPMQLRYPIVDLNDGNIKESIDNFVKLLISSNKYDSISDTDFGFCLEDFRYEAFSSKVLELEKFYLKRILVINI